MFSALFSCSDRDFALSQMVRSFAQDRRVRLVRLVLLVLRVLLVLVPFVFFVSFVFF